MSRRHVVECLEQEKAAVLRERGVATPTKRYVRYGVFNAYRRRSISCIFSDQWIRLDNTRPCAIESRALSFLKPLLEYIRQTVK